MSTPGACQVRTACPYCGVGCGLVAHVRGDRLTAVEGDPAHPVNRGRLCAKPLGLPLAVGSPDRATVPLMREGRDRRFEATTWDDVLPALAARLLEIRSRHGPGAIAFYVSGQMLTEDYYVANKLAKGFLGTPNLDSNSRLCMASAVAGYRGSFGSDGPPPAYEDIEQADCFLLLGTNTAACHPIVWTRIRDRQAEGAFVIVADPRRTETAAAADLHLPVRPGTDLALLNGMLNVIGDEGLGDGGYVRRHASGSEELIEEVARWPVERAAEVTGVPGTDIAAAARRFAGAGGAMALWAVGSNQSTVGTLKTQALNNLCVVTGQIGRPGAGPLSLTGQPNAMGGRETGGVAGGLPGYRLTSSAEHREEMRSLWNLPAGAGIPAEPGLVATDLFDALETGAVRAVWICATNPAASMPDSERAREALRRAQLVVCQDAYHPTETSALAHAVLPAAQWPEKDGTMTNSERRVSLVRKALEPPGAALADWEIFARLGRALGFEEAFSYADAAEVYEEFTRCTVGRLCDQSGLSHARLRREGSLQWPCPAGAGGTARLYADGAYATPDGRARLVPTPHSGPAEPPDHDYPMLLTTGRVASQWHTMTRTAKSPRLLAAEPLPFLEVNPGDAARLGLRDGEPARVASRRGAVVLAARITDTVPEGTVFAPMHWGELHAPPGSGSVNDTTSRASDPTSRQPELKACAVRVDPVAAARSRAPAARRTRLVVVGGGMAGVSAVESVFEHSAPDAWRVTIVGDEPELPYDRTLLSRIDRPAATTGHPLHPPEWYAEHGAELRTGAEVSRIDPERRTVTTAAGERLEYDALVIATGSRPAVPPIAGLEREGVHFLRTVADARAIVAHARTAGYALVVGGGLLGLELARGLVEVGVPVTVAHLMDHLMETHLDEPAAWLLEKQLRHAGVEVLCGVDAVEVTGDHHAAGLRFSTGAEIEGDLVAVAVGIDPNVELASSAGLEVARGIVVDDEGRTSAPRTWAVGECAEHRGVVHGVWAPLREQAQAAGASIAGRPAGFQGGVAATTLHVAGANLFTTGRHSMAGDDELTVADTRSGRYQKLVLSRGRVVGAILLGDVTRGARVRDLIARREGVSPELLVDLIDSSGTPAPTPGTIVCTCNRVSTEAIAAAARDGGLATVEEVAEATGAGSGCGACVGDVRAVLETA